MRSKTTVSAAEAPEYAKKRRIMLPPSIFRTFLGSGQGLVPYCPGGLSVYTYMCVCACIYVCVCVYVFMYVCMYVCALLIKSNLTFLSHFYPSLPSIRTRSG